MPEKTCEAGSNSTSTIKQLRNRRQTNKSCYNTYYINDATANYYNFNTFDISNASVNRNAKGAHRRIELNAMKKWILSENIIEMDI